MENLRKQGSDDAIATFIDTERPFLGICIGMQVLMERSNEFGEHAGLGHIKGSVERIPNISGSGSRVKVPHIGWAKVNNTSTSLNNHASCILKEQNYFYFVHSYMCSPTSIDNVLAAANYYGNKITAIVGRDNILGVQFHPERSGNEGLSFLNHYLK